MTAKAASGQEEKRVIAGDPYKPNKLAYHPEIIQRLRQGENNTLIQVHLMPQNACNQRCDFCSYRMPNNKNSITFDESKMLSLEVLRQLVKDMKTLGVKAVEVTGGGEPLAHKNKYEMFELLFDAGFDVGLVTNGTLVDEKLAKLLAPNLTWMRISLDAATEETYCKLRKASKNQYHKALNAFRLIRAAGSHKSEFRFGAGYVMSNGNELEVYEICKLVKELGADNIRLSMTFSDLHLEYFKDKEKIKEGLAQAERAVKELNDDTFRVINLIPERFKNLYDSRNDYPFCYTKDVLCVIEGTGTVYTCCTFTGSEKGELGNIHHHKDNFLGIWKDSQAFRKNLDPRTYCNVTCLYAKRNLEMLSMIQSPDFEITDSEKPIHLSFI